MDYRLPDVNEEVCGRKAGMFIKGNMRDLYSVRNVLNLAYISVKILVVMLLLKFCKTLSLERKWGTGTQYVPIISYNCR